MFGDIPVLGRAYKLHNVQSSGKCLKKASKFCNDLITNSKLNQRHSNLTIIDDERYDGAGATPEMENCRLNLLTKHKDLATALISRGFAKLIHEDNSERIS